MLSNNINLDIPQVVVDIPQHIILRKRQQLRKKLLKQAVQKNFVVKQAIERLTELYK